jgi:hypothetical protein
MLIEVHDAAKLVDARITVLSTILVTLRLFPEIIAHGPNLAEGVRCLRPDEHQVGEGRPDLPTRCQSSTACFMRSRAPHNRRMH